LYSGRFTTSASIVGEVLGTSPLADTHYLGSPIPR
jgi:hypothetical protein